MSSLYSRLRVRRVMLQPEIEKEPEPELEPEPEPEPPHKFGYVLMALMGLILVKN